MQMFNGITSRALSLCRAKYDGKTSPENGNGSTNTVDKRIDAVSEKKLNELIKELEQTSDTALNENDRKFSLEKINDIFDDKFINYILNDPKLFGKLYECMERAGNTYTEFTQGKDFKKLIELFNKIPGKLTELTQEQAESLGHLWHINLDSLTNLTPNIAKGLSKYGRKNQRRAISLNGLTTIDRDAISSLGNFQEIHLDGLKEIDEESLKVLINNRTGFNTGEGISLCGLGKEAINKIDWKKFERELDGQKCRIWLDKKLKGEIECNNELIKFVFDDGNKVKFEK